MCIVESWAGIRDVSVDCEDVITAFAREDRGVAPAPAEEEKHHQDHSRETRYRTDVRRRFHYTNKYDHNQSTQRKQEQCLYTIGRIDAAYVGHHSELARGHFRDTSRTYTPNIKTYHAFNLFVELVSEALMENNWDV